VQADELRTFFLEHSVEGALSHATPTVDTIIAATVTGTVAVFGCVARLERRTCTELRRHLKRARADGDRLEHEVTATTGLGIRLLLHSLRMHANAHEFLCRRCCCRCGCCCSGGGWRHWIQPADPLDSHAPHPRPQPRRRPVSTGTRHQRTWT
jgi:hypothetical protein